MRFQELIDQTDLDMTEAQVKAFFLGAMCAEKPMAFGKAVEELLNEVADAKATLEPGLQKLWDETAANKKAELAGLFPKEDDMTAFLEIGKDQLDYFLTAMSLAGTTTESAQIPEMIEDLEDIVEDMEEFLTDDQVTAEDGEEFKEYILETWASFISTVK